jgi:flavin-dependent dehydrogenase
MKTDVAIIGAGPAGSSCAYLLSKKGVSNILIERKKIPGSPVQCAEFIPLNINQYLDLSKKKEAICQRVNYMDVDTGKETYRFDGKGFMLNRDVFDRYIVELSVNKGGKILVGAVAKSIITSDNKILVHNIAKNGTIEIIYKYLVIATGAKDFIEIKPDFLIPPSASEFCEIGERAARFQPHKQAADIFLQPRIKNSGYIYAIQIKSNLLTRIDSTLIYFRQYIPYGYGWVFPKGDFANVGIGIERPLSNMPLKDSLGLFLNELKRKKVIGGIILSKTSGLVPISGLKTTVFGNIALCGDAAGLTHPITGAGILSAVISGSLLGEYLYESLKNGINLLDAYKEELSSIFGNSLSKAKSRRNILYQKKYSELNPDELDEIVKKSWPAFEEYHKT